MKQKTKINYVCFLNQSGYSQAARDIITSIDRTGKYDIRLRIFGEKPSRSVINDVQYEYFMRMRKKPKTSDMLSIYHCIPTLQRREKKTQKNVGFATFETFQPPDKWIEVLNNNDAIIVPSKFDYKIFAHALIKKPLYYIPHSVNVDFYNLNIPKMNDHKLFTFLFMGTWKKRKGYEQLIEAWLSEFSDKDNVQLVIKTDRPSNAQKYVNMVLKQMGINKGFAPIIFENKVFDEESLPRFVKSADCLISPTLGEGFGYPGLQSMALGVPVIITDFSGCQDYANEDTATLLNPSGFILHKDMDGIPQFRNKKWAFVEVKEIRRAMRYVINNPDIIRKKAGVAYQYVMKRFTYSIVEDLFEKMIQDLYG